MSILLAGLHGLQARHPCVGDVRGSGLFSTLELVHDRDTRAELLPLVGPTVAGRRRDVARTLTDRGLLASLRGSWLFANPPLVITIDQIDEALAILR